MTTVGRWSPNKVRARVLDGTWVSPEELGGMVLLAPTSISYSGTSASIGANGSVEFTACTSLSLNGVFGANYDNYMIAMRYESPGGSSTVSGRFRVSGSDATGANYTRQYLSANSTTVSGARETSQTYFRAGVTFSNESGDVLYLYGPFLAQPTATRNVSAWGRDDARIFDAACTHSLSTSYDGITLVPDFAFTGLVSVYGLVGA